jgi:hypothetical protein
MSSKMSTHLNEITKVARTPVDTQWISLKWEPSSRARTTLASRCSTVTKM